MPDPMDRAETAPFHMLAGHDERIAALEDRLDPMHLRLSCLIEACQLARANPGMVAKDSDDHLGALSVLDAARKFAAFVEGQDGPERLIVSEEQARALGLIP